MLHIYYGNIINETQMCDQIKYRAHVRINLYRLQASPEYKPQKIKGIPPISKKRRHIKKRKNNIRRGLFLRAYGIHTYNDTLLIHPVVCVS